jgi:DNA-binding MarR family transcriptional regulator
LAQRTTHRSSSGRKLYAVRNREGEFEDIQTYKRAHSQDIKRKSKAEGHHEQTTLQLMRAAVQAGESHLEGLIRHLDMTARQFDVLSAIDAAGSPSQTDLVDMTSVDRSTLSDIMRRMAKKGWVQRRRDSNDARAYIVKLTVEGKTTLTAARALAKKVDEKAKGVSRQDLQSAMSAYLEVTP